MLPTRRRAPRLILRPSLVLRIRRRVLLPPALATDGIVLELDVVVRLRRDLDAAAADLGARRGVGPALLAAEARGGGESRLGGAGAVTRAETTDADAAEEGARVFGPEEVDGGGAADEDDDGAFDDAGMDGKVSK